MVGVIDLNRLPRACLRGSDGLGEPSLPYRKPSARKSSRGSSKLQLPKDLTNLRPVLQAFRIDFPVTPREEIVGKRKRARIFVLEHHRRLICVPVMLRRKDCGSQHI